MTSAPAPSTVPRRAVLLSSVLVVATVFGGWRAAVALTSGDSARSLHVGGATYTVTQVEQVGGLSDAELGGMSHNISGLVTDKQQLVRVAVTVAAGNAATTFDPQLLRIYKPGSTVGIPPAGGSFNAGRLAAHARIEGSLSFVVKRDGTRLSLRATGAAGSVPLLQLDGAPAGPSGHEHGADISPTPDSGAGPPVTAK